MPVVKEAANSEAAAVLAASPRDLTNALNSNFLISWSWRGNDDLNTNITSDWWATCALNERAVKRNVAREPALGMLDTVIIPVEDYREVQLVSHSGPSLRLELHNLERED